MSDLTDSTLPAAEDQECPHRVVRRKITADGLSQSGWVCTSCHEPMAVVIAAKTTAPPSLKPKRNKASLHRRT